MDLPPQCASCLQAFGKGRKHDVVINDQTATVNDTKFLLPLTRGLQPCKVCTKCCNRNSELVNGKKRSAPSGAIDAPIPTKKKRESSFIRDRYLVDTKSVEALSILLVNCCPTCGAKWSEVRQRGKGNVLEMDMSCEVGHSVTWSSMPFVINVPDTVYDSSSAPKA